MAERRVTHVRKNNDDDITAIANPVSWGSVTKKEAISEIENKTHNYYVNEDGRVEVKVIDDKQKGKYLRTNADSKSKNNLDNLPLF